MPTTSIFQSIDEMHDGELFEKKLPKETSGKYGIGKIKAPISVLIHADNTAVGAQ
jgi:hypothetical protein